jgi:lipopolysaccharide export system permease protein
MVGFDVMGDTTSLPKSANLVILYTVYQGLFAIDMMTPIALIFGFVASMVELIRSNAMGSFYALGYSRIRVLAPFLFVSILVTTLHVAAHTTTTFARAHEYAENLRDSLTTLTPRENLFFTHEGNYVFFGKLDPLRKKAEDIRVFSFENGHLKEALSAQDAYYDNHYWNIRQAHIVTSPKTLALGAGKITVKNVDQVQLLRDFKPKILDQVYEGKINFTIPDALDALALLKNQNVDLSRIKSTLYRSLITPWFAVMMMVIIFTYHPNGSRFANLSTYGFGGILAALLAWGVLFVGGELSGTKTLSPETGVIAPMLILAFLMSLSLSRFRVKSRHSTKGTA